MKRNNTTQRTTHLTQQEIRDYAFGRLQVDSRGHLAKCGSCLDRVAEALGNVRRLERAADGRRVSVMMSTGWGSAPQ